MQLHDAQGICGAEYRFVREDGDIALTRDVGEPIDICGGDGLLDQLDVQPLVCHLRENPHRLTRPPRLIRVDADAYVFPNSVAHSGEPCNIKRWIDPNLDLEGVIAACNRIACIACHLLRGIHTDGDVRDDAVPRAAEQLVHGDVPELSVEIVEGHIDGGLCR